MLKAPKRTPYLRSCARAGWSSERISSATASRRSTPKFSLRRKAMPRASPAMSWAASISTSGFSRSPISSVSQALSRSRTFSLSGAARCSSANTTIRTA